MGRILVVNTVGSRLTALLDYLVEWGAARGGLSRLPLDTPGLDLGRRIQVLWRRHDDQPLVRCRFRTKDDILVDATYDLREVNDRAYLEQAGVRLDAFVIEKRRQRSGQPRPMEGKKLRVPRQLAEAAEKEGVDHDKMREWSESIVDKVKVA